MSREEVVKLIQDINDLTYREGQIKAYKDLQNHTADKEIKAYCVEQIQRLHREIDDYERKYDK